MKKQRDQSREGKKLGQNASSTMRARRLMNYAAVCGITLSIRGGNPAHIIHAESPVRTPWPHDQSALLDKSTQSLSVQAAHLLKQLQEYFHYILSLGFDAYYILVRSCSLFIYFSPCAAASPVLLMGNDFITSCWWELFRRAIRLSGPCNTKFCQWVATRPGASLISQKNRHFEELLEFFTGNTFALAIIPRNHHFTLAMASLSLVLP